MDRDTLADLIHGAQRGEAGCFEGLIDAFASRIFGFFFRATFSREEAEDLMQEVFLRLVRTIASYQHEDRFESWLFRIAANLARDRLRHQRRSPRPAAHGHRGGGYEVDSEPTDALEGMAGEAEAVDARLIHREELDAIGEALERLPVAEREVLILRHFSQMSFKEIAEATGTPLGTALARAHRGLAKLRKWCGASALPRGESGHSSPGDQDGA